MNLLDKVLGAKGRAKIGNVELDISITESHEREATVTEHAVEDGSLLADGVIPGPIVLTMEGKVTNTPLSTGFPGQTAVSAIRNLAHGDSNSPVENARKELNRVMDQSERFTAVTSLKTYDNVVMTSLKITRNSANGGTLFFTATLTEITVGSIQTTTSFLMPKDPANQVEKPKGKKGTQSAPPQQEEATASVLASVFG
jgi:hypothetical protein